MCTEYFKNWPKSVCVNKLLNFIEHSTEIPIVSLLRVQCIYYIYIIGLNTN